MTRTSETTHAVLLRPNTSTRWQSSTEVVFKGGNSQLKSKSNGKSRLPLGVAPASRWLSCGHLAHTSRGWISQTSPLPQGGGCPGFFVGVYIIAFSGYSISPQILPL